MKKKPKPRLKQKARLVMNVNNLTAGQPPVVADGQIENGTAKIKGSNSHSHSRRASDSASIKSYSSHKTRSRKHFDEGDFPLMIVM